MKKVSSFLIVLLCSATLFSCGKNKEAEDTRLDAFSKDSMVEFINNAKEFNVKYVANERDCGIIKTATQMTIIEEDIVYTISNDKYFSSDPLAADLDLTSDALANIEFYVECYGYSYAKHLKNMSYIGETKMYGYSCYKYEASLALDEKNRSSGFIYTIEKESGLALKVDTYGNNASLFDKTGLKFEVSEFSYSL